MNKRFRTPYSGHSLEPVKMYTHGDKVAQEVRDECDINKIFDSYVATGCLPVTRDLEYNGAILDKGKYLDAYNLVQKAQSDFDTLPSNVRAEFGNNVLTYLSEFDSAYQGDSQKLEKFTKLNILNDTKSQEIADSVSASRSISSLTPRGDSKTEVKSSVTDNTSISDVKEV